MSTLKMIYRPFFTILLVMGLFSCEFRIKETEYDNGPGKAQEDPNSEMSNPDVSKDFLLGKFDYRKDEKFVLVDKKWSKKEVYLQKKAFVAFVKMAEAAKEDGVDLFILSGTRSFSDQKKVWEDYWKKNQKKIKNPKDNAKKILLYNSMPGTSRHHWGTDIDINSDDPKYFEKDAGKKIYRWLVENATKYGFCQVYTDKKRSKRTGYSTEVWHWSYMPLSNYYLDNYTKNVSYSDIKGFTGSEQAKELTIIQNYVQGIDRACSSLSTTQSEEK
jgi:LAS superfamily LD-carboxypeptidase LdcB